MERQVGGRFMDAHKFNKIQKEYDRKEEEWSRKVLF